MSEHRCRVCDAAVTSAQEGVVFRAGGLVLVLCTRHARLAGTSALIMGQAAVRGLEQVLEARNPRALGAVHAGVQAVNVVRDVLEALEPEPVRPRVEASTPRRRHAETRRTRVRDEDVIDVEWVEVKT